VKESQDAAAGLALSLEPVAPRPELRARVLAAATGSAPAPRPAMATRLFWSGLAVLGLLALLVSLFSDFESTENPLKAGDKYAPAAGKVFWRGTSLQISATHVPPLPAGKVYQLWRLRRARATESAGLFTVDRDGNLRGSHVLLTPIFPEDDFALTIEPAGGSAAPSGPMVLIPAD
jgi:anti-sigma-K factor RskA